MDTLKRLQKVNQDGNQWLYGNQSMARAVYTSWPSVMSWVLTYTGFQTLGTRFHCVQNCCIWPCQTQFWNVWVAEGCSIQSIASELKANVWTQRSSAHPGSGWSVSTWHLSLRASSPGHSGGGREKEGELATKFLEFEYLHRKSRCKILIGGDDIGIDVITLNTCLLTFALVST